MEIMRGWWGPRAMTTTTSTSNSAVCQAMNCGNLMQPATAVKTCAKNLLSASRMRFCAEKHEMVLSCPKWAHFRSQSTRNQRIWPLWMIIWCNFMGCALKMRGQEPVLTMHTVLTSTGDGKHDFVSCAHPNAQHWPTAKNSNPALSWFSSFKRKASPMSLFFNFTSLDFTSLHFTTQQSTIISLNNLQWWIHHPSSLRRHGLTMTMTSWNSPLWCWSMSSRPRSSGTQK